MAERDIEPASASTTTHNALVEDKPRPTPGFGGVHEALLQRKISRRLARVDAPSSAGALVQRKADPNFEKLTGKDLKESDAPADITLPDELTKGMQAGWDKSLPGGKSQEQGGNLVKNKDGSYEFRPGKAGSSGAFTPDYNDVGKDQTLIGVGHTHPYDEDEGGYTDVSLSGGDLSSIVYEAQPLNIVQSGETLFVVGRTAEFEEMLKGLDKDGKKKLAIAIEKTWDDVYTKTKGKVPERAEAATQATCLKYHLVYYRGKGSKLSKVNLGGGGK